MEGEGQTRINVGAREEHRAHLLTPTQQRHAIEVHQKTDIRSAKRKILFFWKQVLSRAEKNVSQNDAEGGIIRLWGKTEQSKERQTLS